MAEEILARMVSEGTSPSPARAAHLSSVWSAYSFGGGIDVESCGGIHCGCSLHTSSSVSSTLDGVIDIAPGSVLICRCGTQQVVLFPEGEPRIAAGAPGLISGASHRVARGALGNVAMHAVQCMPCCGHAWKKARGTWDDPGIFNRAQAAPGDPSLGRWWGIQLGTAGIQRNATVASPSSRLAPPPRPLLAQTSSFSFRDSFLEAKASTESLFWWPEGIGQRERGWLMMDDNHNFGDHSRPGQEVGSAEELWQSQDGRVGSHGSGSTGGGGLGSPRRDSNSGIGGGEEEQQHRGSNTPPSAGTASPSTSGEGSRSRPESVVGVSSQIRGYVTRKVPVQRAAAAAAGASRLFATPAAYDNDDDEEEGCGEEEMDDDPPPAPKSEDFLALAVRLPSFEKPGHEISLPVPVPLITHVKA
jgi:hypothetical protein